MSDTDLILDDDDVAAFEDAVESEAAEESSEAQDVEDLPEGSLQEPTNETEALEDDEENNFTVDLEEDDEQEIANIIVEPVFKTRKNDPLEEKPAKPVKINIDLTTIRKSNSVIDTMNLMTNKIESPTTKVMALQSGYSTEITPLKFMDISRLNSSSVDAYAAKMKILTVLFKHMNNTSGPKMTFQQFLKTTSNGDYNTLMYGLYSATYPGYTELDVNCNHCRKSNKIKLLPTDMMHVHDEAVYSEIKELLSNNTNFDKKIEDSPVNKSSIYQLPSGVAVEVRTPSIYDFMNNVKWHVDNTDEKTNSLSEERQGEETIKALMMYIKSILVQEEDGGWVQISDNVLKRKFLEDIGTEGDSTALMEIVNGDQEALAVYYKTPKFKCGHCSKSVNELFLEYENLLFTKVRKMG